MASNARWDDPEGDRLLIYLVGETPLTHTDFKHLFPGRAKNATRTRHRNSLSSENAPARVAAMRVDIASLFVDPDENVEDEVEDELEQTTLLALEMDDLYDVGRNSSAGPPPIKKTEAVGCPRRWSRLVYLRRCFQIHHRSPKVSSVRTGANFGGFELAIFSSSSNFCLQPVLSSDISSMYRRSSSLLRSGR